MRLPSTTGMVVNVSKNPALLIAKFAASRVEVSTQVRQLKLSVESLQLKTV